MKYGGGLPCFVISVIPRRNPPPSAANPAGFGLPPPDSGSTRSARSPGAFAEVPPVTTTPVAAGPPEAADGAPGPEAAGVAQPAPRTDTSANRQAIRPR